MKDRWRLKGRRVRMWDGVGGRRGAHNGGETAKRGRKEHEEYGKRWK